MLPVLFPPTEIPGSFALYPKDPEIVFIYNRIIVVIRSCSLMSSARKLGVTCGTEMPRLREARHLGRASVQVRTGHAVSVCSLPVSRGNHEARAPIYCSGPVQLWTRSRAVKQSPSSQLATAPCGRALWAGSPQGKGVGSRTQATPRSRRYRGRARTVSPACTGSPRGRRPILIPSCRLVAKALVVPVRDGGFGEAP